MVRQNRYWLWIIPDWQEGLWDLCKKNNVLAMHYPPGWKNEKKNQELAAEISKGDYIISYLNNKTIGGFGKVKSTVYEALEENSWKEDIEFDYSTRIQIEWEIIDDIGWTYQGFIKEITGINILYTATIHELNPIFFDKIKEWIEEQVTDYENSTQKFRSFDIQNLIMASDLQLRERALKDFIVENLEKIFSPGWYLFEDEEGNIGYEYQLGRKIIDLIVVSPDDQVNILELKVVQVQRDHIKQIEEYLQKFQDIFIDPAKGIIIAPAITKAAEKRLKSIPHVRFLQYHLYFNFNKSK